MKIFVEPKKLPSKITKLEFVSLVSDMGEEWSEVTRAITEYVTNPSPKNREHLMEELGDLITVATNNMLALERMDPPIKDMVWVAFLKVALKNYARGYHDELEKITLEAGGKNNEKQF